MDIKTEQDGTASIVENKRNIVRKLYDWVLHWADTPYGTLALFLLAFSESSFFPIPPDVLLIALILGRINKAFFFATICSVASIIGGLAGYGIGSFIWRSFTWQHVDTFFFTYIPGFTEEIFSLIQNNYQEYGFFYVFTAGFTPIPYKVFTIGAGVFELNLGKFILASALSRSARFFIVAALLYKFGAPIKEFIDKYFNLLATLFILLLVGGFVVIKYLL
jgi:membrane protein YqaA with SNARE-associated domain